MVSELVHDTREREVSACVSFQDEQSSLEGMTTFCSLGKMKDVAGESSSPSDSDHECGELVRSNLVLRTRFTVWKHTKPAAHASVGAVLCCSSGREALIRKLHPDVTRDSNLVDSASSIRLSQRLSHACLSINKSIL